MKILNAIRNIIGAIIVVVGAFVFQIGFFLMTENMQEEFAKGMVKHFQKVIV